MFKYQGTYYMTTSGCTDWAPNEALAHVAESIMSPWETLSAPSICGNKVFQLTVYFALSTFVLRMPILLVFLVDIGKDGTSTKIYGEEFGF
ncbi:glycosidase [Lithospermum erythrorhizon]|uniref:Glycosidase n=1 Tax=Lithospermum erythrorhizon TaxID=34254 RepID=A0AAV3P2X0_LITER